jgi:hypothetical protein
LCLIFPAPNNTAAAIHLVGCRACSWLLPASLSTDVTVTAHRQLLHRAPIPSSAGSLHRRSPKQEHVQVPVRFPSAAGNTSGAANRRPKPRLARQFRRYFFIELLDKPLRFFVYRGLKHLCPGPQGQLSWLHLPLARFSPGEGASSSHTPQHHSFPERITSTRGLSQARVHQPRATTSLPPRDKTAGQKRLNLVFFRPGFAPGTHTSRFTIHRQIDDRLPVPPSVHNQSLCLCCCAWSLA